MKFQALIFFIGSILPSIAWSHGTTASSCVMLLSDSAYNYATAHQEVSDRPNENFAAYLRLLDFTLQGIDEVESTALQHINRNETKIRLLEAIANSNTATDAITELQKLVPDLIAHSRLLIALRSTEAFLRVIDNLADEWQNLRQFVVQQTINLQSLRSNQLVVRSAVEEDYDDFPDHNGDTRIHRFLREQRYAEAAKLLEQPNISERYVSRRNNRTQTPLDIFRESTYDEKVADLLLQKNAKSHLQLNRLERHLIEASEKGDIEKIKLLYRQGADINCLVFYQDFLNSPLQVAIGNNQIEAARLLLSLGADLLSTTLEYAITKNAKIESIEFLFSLDSDVLTAQLFKLNFYYFSKAVRAGRADFLRLCIKHGIDINKISADESAMHYVSVNAHEMIELLLTVNIDINKHNSGGFTPLAEAVKLKQYEALQAFLEAGADYTIRTNDDKQKTPLEIALSARDKRAQAILENYIARQPLTKRLSGNLKIWWSRPAKRSAK